MGNLPERDAEVLNFLDSPLCFRENKSGMPSHPLYLPSILKPSTYSFEKETAHP